jgi:hypothetical protein
VAAFDERYKISVGLQLEQEIQLEQEADGLKPVDELVAEANAMSQLTADDQVGTAEDVN